MAFWDAGEALNSKRLKAEKEECTQQVQTATQPIELQNASKVITLSLCAQKQTLAI